VSTVQAARHMFRILHTRQAGLCVGGKWSNTEARSVLERVKCYFTFKPLYTYISYFQCWWEQFINLHDMNAGRIFGFLDRSRYFSIK
jgi:hypothetical protein